MLQCSQWVCHKEDWYQAFSWCLTENYDREACREPCSISLPAGLPVFFVVACIMWVVNCKSLAWLVLQQETVEPAPQIYFLPLDGKGPFTLLNYVFNWFWDVKAKHDFESSLKPEKSVLFDFHWGNLVNFYTVVKNVIITAEGWSIKLSLFSPALYCFYCQNIDI